MTRSRILFVRNETIEEPTVNLTPLIDVVFVILIMFIVIAPLLELDRIELAESTSQSHQETHSVNESSPISLHVHQNNTISLNGHLIDRSELLQKLKDAKSAFPKAIPQVFHDKNATFGTYQFIKNASESAGFSQIDIILKPS